MMEGVEQHRQARLAGCLCFSYHSLILHHDLAWTPKEPPAPRRPIFRAAKGGIFFSTSHESPVSVFPDPRPPACFQLVRNKSTRYCESRTSPMSLERLSRITVEEGKCG